MLNTLRTKGNNSDKKVSDTTTSTERNQYNTYKQRLKKKIGDIDKKNTRYKCFSDYNCFEYKN